VRAELPIRQWRPGRLLGAPHRLSFAGAAALLTMASLWWATVNIASNLGLAMPMSLPPAVAHGALMTFGFMPMFFVGFLFTAGPKWLHTPPVTARALAAPVAAQLVGWLLYMVSFHVGEAGAARALCVSGVAIALSGWSGVVLQFVRMLRRSRADDKVHLRLVALAATFGIVGLGLVAFGLLGGSVRLVRGAIHLSLWWFIGLTFAAMAHRMVPFFSGAAAAALQARWPTWMLWCLALLFLFEGGASFIEVLGWSDSPAWRFAHASVELASGVGLLVLARRSAAAAALRLRMPGMLFAGFVWLGASFVLAGAARLASQSLLDTRDLQLAATHAYTMGFLGSTLFAMVTRVASGQSGRTVAADGTTWRLFWLLQSAVGVRIGGGLVAPVSPRTAAVLIAGSAILWAVACLAWSARCMAWYGLPRIDGREG